MLGQTIQFFHGVPRRRRRGATRHLPAVEIVTRNKLGAGDIVTVGNQNYYYDPDDWGGTLVRELIAVDSRGVEIRRVIAPADPNALVTGRGSNRVNHVVSSEAQFSVVIVRPK